MYKQIAEILNEVEDEVLGAESWSPPKTFIGGTSSERLYATYPESMFAVDGVPTVTALLHKKEVIFISNNGAVQVHRRLHGLPLHAYRDSADTLITSKPDAWGEHVWPSES